jgi:DNA-binding NarL/FixJ family response regulator
MGSAAIYAVSAARRPPLLQGPCQHGFVRDAALKQVCDAVDRRGVAADAARKPALDTVRAHDAPAAPAPAVEPTRVFVVDDHELFRNGLRELLAQDGLDVVGEAASGESACEAVPGLGPDVVVMDLELPQMSGVEATRRLRETTPLARVVVFTMAADDSSVTAAIEAGAVGYVLKDAPAEEMLSAVRAVAAGESPISPRAAGPLFDRLRADASARPTHPDLEKALTAREVQVLRLLAEGKSNAEIGSRLYISPTTVKHHTSSILTKLGVENRVQAAVRAVQGRIV